MDRFDFSATMYTKPGIFSWISQLGVNPGLNRMEVARIVILNRLNLAGASAAVLVGIKDIILKGLELTVLIPILMFFVGELVLSYLKLHNLARYAANIVLPLLLTAVLLLYGPSIGGGYTLFVFITTAIIFHQKWAVRIALIVFIILLFTGSSIALLSISPPLADKVDPLDSIITFIGTSLAVSLMITYFFHENQKYEEEQALLMKSLKSSNAALQKANIELERFAYIASHDLKTPIRNISSFLGLAERDLEKGKYDDLHTYFRFARAGARQMNTLVEDILDFSRLNNPDEHQIESTDLNKLLMDCTKQLRGTYGDEFEVKLRDLPTIHTSPNLLSILCMNLLDNAIKYNTTGHPAVEVSASALSAKWVIAFKDNGIGIPAEFQEKVFDMFQRLHPPDQYSGTGIGLAMCKKVAERLGGKITLRSQPGKGSTFLVALPKTPPAETALLAYD
ncbi:MAG: sensor histidine kinase [Phaeodactylibacter xiamenensis]|uniref:sensor histidine kinase n=1 Tax=Phaeodactylibacter xiamenensis TaxID=1524460 RepID=UPI000696FF1B|nr:ATP-binding protein [Phaeodactylibacter xiamenensis]MCR9055118.1 ATP-binding protein [bacterium]